MAAIGTAWADGAWVFAGWASSAWNDAVPSIVFADLTEEHDPSRDHLVRRIRQGDSLTFAFGLGGEILDDWVCNIEVKEFPGDVALISRAISLQKNNAFVDALRSSETTSLVSGKTYRLYGRLTNSVSGLAETQMLRFSVGAPAA